MYAHPNINRSKRQPITVTLVRIAVLSGVEIVDMGDDLCYLFKNHGDLYIIILVIMMLLLLLYCLFCYMYFLRVSVLIYYIYYNTIERSTVKECIN